jgi:hypothetical protein
MADGKKGQAAITLLPIRAFAIGLLIRPSTDATSGRARPESRRLEEWTKRLTYFFILNSGLKSISIDIFTIQCYKSCSGGSDL